VRGMHQYHLGKVWRSSFVTRYRFARRADVSLGCTQYERAPEMKMVIFFTPTSRLELWRNQNSVAKYPCPLTSLTSQASFRLVCTNDLATHTSPLFLPSHSLGLTDLKIL
jgi:hypothetical protein